jgi:hypothetical protein
LLSEYNPDPNANPDPSSYHHNYGPSTASSSNEARRVGYHVICRCGITGESEETKRRRRLRGWIPEIPQGPPEHIGRISVGDRIPEGATIEDCFHFEDTGQDEFVAVVTSSAPIVATLPPPQTNPQLVPSAAPHPSSWTPALPDASPGQTTMDTNVFPFTNVAPAGATFPEQILVREIDNARAGVVFGSQLDTTSIILTDESSSSQYSQKSKVSSVAATDVGDSVRTEPLDDTDKEL